MEVLPLPLGMAIAKRPPSNTAFSTLLMIFMWSGEKGRRNVLGKYVTQKNLKSRRPLALRAGSTTAGMSPMSLPASAMARLRSCSLFFFWR